MFETIRNILYLFSLALLWFCIALDIHSWRMVKKFANDYMEAIIRANEVRERFEKGIEENEKIHAELIKDREYFHNLRDQEEHKDEQV